MSDLIGGVNFQAAYFVLDLFLSTVNGLMVFVASGSSGWGAVGFIVTLALARIETGVRELNSKLSKLTEGADLSAPKTK